MLRPVHPSVRPSIDLSVCPKPIAGQGYLLTSMDRATLPRTLSTILRCVQSWMLMWSPGNERRQILNAFCYTDRQLQVVSTYVNGEAQAPLVRFVVDIFYKPVRNKSTTDRTVRVEPIMYRPIASFAFTVRCEQQKSTVDGIVDLT